MSQIRRIEKRLIIHAQHSIEQTLRFTSTGSREWPKKSALVVGDIDFQQRCAAAFLAGVTARDANAFAVEFKDELDAHFTGADANHVARIVARFAPQRPGYRIENRRFSVPVVAA